jgi:hypothetical protein
MPAFAHSIPRRRPSVAGRWIAAPETPTLDTSTTHPKEHIMNILANMEAIFLVTLGLLGTGLMLL